MKKIYESCFIKVMTLTLLLLFSDILPAQNLRPSIKNEISTLFFNENESINYSLEDLFFDADGDNLEYHLENNPSWLSIENYHLKGTAEIGDHTIQVVATDPHSNTASIEIQLSTLSQSVEKAAFNIEQASGCGYLKTTFTNKSVQASSWSWDFGDGNTPSSYEHVSHTYPNPGVYKVTLTINGGSSSYTSYVKVYPNPEPKIDVENFGNCSPVEANYMSVGSPVQVSTYTNNGALIGAITGADAIQYYWNIYDGSEGVFTDTELLHIDSVPIGNANALLTITDERGCRGSKFEYNLFEVSATPQATFEVDKNDACDLLEATLSSTSTIEQGEISEYYWEIDGDFISNEPTFKYTNFTRGKDHSVSLKVKSTLSCWSEPEVQIIKYNQNNNFDFSFEDGCVLEAIELRATSDETITKYLWNINGEGYSTNKSPEHSFTTSGSKIVTLTATFDDGCSKQLSHTANMIELDGDVLADYSQSCETGKVTLTETYSTNTSNQVHSVHWYIVDADKNEQLIGQGSSISHFFDLKKQTQVKVKIESQVGCTIEVPLNINLQNPTIEFTTSRDEGCIPLDVELESSFSHERMTIASVIIDPKNGDSPTNHESCSTTYTSEGLYTPKVSYTTNEGCTYEQELNIKAVVQPKIISHSVDNTTFCYGDGLDINLSFENNIDELRVVYDDVDTTIININSDEYIYHHEPENIGIQEIQLFAIKNSCYSDQYEINSLVAVAPKAEFTTTETSYCAAPSIVQFTNLSETDGITTSYLWDFDDDGITSTEENPSHLFQNGGIYKVTLTATSSNGCSDTYEYDLIISEAYDNADIIEITEPNSCLNQRVSLTINEDNLPENFIPKNYEWTLNGASHVTTQVNDSISAIYLAPGTYPTKILITASNGCMIQSSMDKQVNGPLVGFDLPPAPYCLDDAMHFTNTSSTGTNDPALFNNYSYEWTFESGKTSNDKDPNYKFQFTGNHTITLKVIDENGCKNSAVDVLNIDDNRIDFRFEEIVNCATQEAKFINTSNLIRFNSFDWDFETDNTTDATTTTETTITHQYENYGDYIATLTGHAINGCVRNYEVPVRAAKITADFSVQNQDVGCAPAMAHFTASAEAIDVENILWDFGDGFTSDILNPSHIYATPGKYTVGLTINFKNGCSDTKTVDDYITVRGAYGEFYYEASSDCAPHEVLFEAKNLSEVSHVCWDFGNGIIDTTHIELNVDTYANIEYSYTDYAETYPVLVLSDDGSCGSYSYYLPDEGPIVTSTPPETNFSFDENKRSVCENNTVHFENNTSITVPGETTLTYKWYIDDVFVSENLDLDYSFTSPGDHIVKLEASSNGNCWSSHQEQLNIISQNTIEAKITTDDLSVCTDQELTIINQSTTENGNFIGDQWRFYIKRTSNNFITNLSWKNLDTLSHTLSKKYEGDQMLLRMIIQDEAYCQDTAELLFDVIDVDPSINISDKTPYRGQTVTFSDQSETSKGNINDWAWSFETGAPETWSGRTPEPILYETIKTNVDVQLKVITDEGCRDSITTQINVLNNPPEISHIYLEVYEDAKYTFRDQSFEDAFNTEKDPDQKLERIKVFNQPDIGTLAYQGSTIENFPIEIQHAMIDQLTYTPPLDWSGETSFIYSSSDGYDFASSKKVNLEVVSINDSLDTFRDEVVTYEDTPIDIYFFRNDYDPDHNVIINSLYLSTEPELGTYEFNLVDTIIRYTPQPNIHGDDRMRYALSDATGASDSSWIDIEIIPVDDDPIANIDTIYIYENETVTAKNILQNDVEPDGELMIVDRVNDELSKITEGTYGEITWDIEGNVNYERYAPTDTLQENESVLDRFSYCIKDINNNESVSEIIIKIIGLNNQPIANDDNYSIDDQSTTLSISSAIGLTNNDEDIDGDATYVTEINTKNEPRIEGIFGEIEWQSNGTFEYTLNEKIDSLTPEEFVIEKFQYKISDSKIESEEADAFITIQGTNQAPEANNDVYNVEENAKLISTTGLGILENDYDPEDEGISLRKLISSEGKYGYINWFQNGNIVYHIDTDEVETIPLNRIEVDSFIYVIEDARGAVDTAYIMFNFYGDNAKPVANNDTIYLSEEDPIYDADEFNSLLNNDTDSDENDQLHLVSLSNGEMTITDEYGVIEVQTNGLFSFIGNQTQLDSLKPSEIISLEYEYNITDIVATDTAQANVIIIIEGVNDAFIAVNDTIEVRQNLSTVIEPLLNDIDPDENIDFESLTVLTEPQRGDIIEMDGGKITYSPNHDLELGTDSIRYAANDESGVTDTAWIIINIIEANYPPVTPDRIYYTPRFQSLVIDLDSIASDPEGDQLSYSLSELLRETDGTLTIDHSIFEFIPNSEDFISTSFTYEAFDNVSTPSEGLITVKVIDNPLVEYTDTIDEDTSLELDVYDIMIRYSPWEELDFNEITIEIDANYGQLNVDNEDELVLYTPLSNHCNMDIPDQFMYRLSRGGSYINFAVSIYVRCINDAPVAVNDTIFDANQGVQEVGFVLPNDYDIDLGDTLTVDTKLYEDMYFRDGEIAIDALGEFVYDPDPNFYGWTKFSYQIHDIDLLTSVADVHIRVIPNADSLQAMYDIFSVTENRDTTYRITENDQITGDLNICEIITEPYYSQNFYIDQVTHDLYYQPEQHVYGVRDSLEYRIVNEYDQMDTNWILIDIIQNNTPPIANTDTLLIDFGGNGTIDLMNNDIDPDFINGDMAAHIIRDSLRIVFVEEEDASYTIDSTNQLFIYQSSIRTCEQTSVTYEIQDNEGGKSQGELIIIRPEKSEITTVVDTVETYLSIESIFHPLANDRGFIDSTTLNIINQPNSGIVDVLDDYSMIYHPSTMNAGIDSMQYTVSNYCGDTFTGKVIFIISELRVPEIISPNGDGKNDRLIIDGIENFENSCLKIYNRYGHLVFDATGYDNTWEGYSTQGNAGGAKPLPTGTYHYILTYYSEELTQTGIIYIFR